MTDAPREIQGSSAVGGDVRRPHGDAAVVRYIWVSNQREWVVVSKGDRRGCPVILPMPAHVFDDARAAVEDGVDRRQCEVGAGGESEAD